MKPTRNPIQVVPRVVGAAATTAMLVFWLLSPSVAAGDARDPWYLDLWRHWAEHEIRILWSEDLTDGDLRNVYTGGQLRRSAYFHPDDQITRAQWVMLLAKAFRVEPYENPLPSFSDLTPDYVYYRVKKPYPHIEGAYRAAIVRGFPDRRFLPEQELARQEAIATLVRSLGLAGFAAALSPAEVNDSLARFWDRWRIDDSLLKEVALAVRLGIIKGYPDGALRPARGMTRAEGAAIIYRSCLYDLLARPNPFSPDGDGFEDATIISVRTLRNQNLTRWEAFITDWSGKVLRDLKVDWLAQTPQDRRGPVPDQIRWTGLDYADRVLRPGTYYYWGWGDDREGNRHQAVMKPIILTARTLGGYLFPEVVPPGGTLEVRAQTTGNATAVTAGTLGISIPLAATAPVGSDGSLWAGTVTLPADVPAGGYTLTLRAEFDGPDRTLQLPFTVYDPLTLEAEVHPNPARAGTEVALTARTSENAEQVTVTLAGATRFLERVSPDRWVAHQQLPLAIDPGLYPAVFQARAGSRSREVTVLLAIEASPLEGVVFSLTGW